MLSKTNSNTKKIIAGMSMRNHLRQFGSHLKRPIKRAVQTILVGLVALISLPAFASGAWLQNFQPPILIGEGTLKFFVWEIYDVRLFAASKPFSRANDLVLEFDYKRELSKDEVIKASIKEMKRQNGVNQNELDGWQGFLEQGMQSVQDETKAAVYWSPEGRITFYYEGSEPVTINNAEFANAFVDIWLGEQTSQPELRNSLLGSEE